MKFFYRYTLLFALYLIRLDRPCLIQAKFKFEKIDAKMKQWEGGGGNNNLTGVQ